MLSLGRPAMTTEQREIAIELLANAWRKGARGRSRASSAVTGNDLAGVLAARAEADDRYVRGMRDMLGVLFRDGPAGADACLAAARRLEAGPGSGNGIP